MGDAINRFSQPHEKDPDHIAGVSKLGDLISRQAAVQTALEFIVEYLGGAFDEDFQKELMERMSAIPPAQSEPQWTPCSERLPECEQEVLICTKRKLVGENAYIDSIITPASYEDGTMSENESKWHWEDVDFEKWDEEEDCGIIPEGWWESRHFNPDGVYNNVVDREVVAWMPLPEPYVERRENE